ncbi:hypothetical protein PPERSA_05298 [Pseudocohnilembus persalinus]|uniref:Band 7 domain-containing protein n=1 Tax=Pseudocohnilembus persalinus TaxID=266149 RepID=A0A0V0R5Y6_PSEPJ|nr:hypothetical protein PPERSA_05298 [Pseudocohnilembus persalinus]|eukprot:KRX09906.1 hypothetical protein PPERSA_05298 [Pseudocohnilembus persalinus]
MQQNNTFPKQPRPVHLEIKENDEDNKDQNCYTSWMKCLGDCFGCLRTWIPCCCCVDYPYQMVSQSSEGLFERFGRYIKTSKAGLHYVNPCTDSMQKVDMRIKVIDLQRQMMLTKDNVSINVDASVYYRIINPRYAIYRINDFQTAVTELTYSLLKNTCGQFILQDLLEKRAEIADDIEKQVEIHVKEWGIKIENIYMKDIQLNQDLQESLSSAAKERRLAEAKLISAKADVESAKLMREAADILDSRTAMQIRYLETIGMIGKAGNTKIIFLPNEEDQDQLQHKITQGLMA